MRTHIVTLTSNVQQLELDGDSAIATTQVRGVAGVIDCDGPFGVTNAAQVLEITATVRDEWVRAADHWRRRSHTKIVANYITSTASVPR